MAITTSLDSNNTAATTTTTYTQPAAAAPQAAPHQPSGGFSAARRYAAPPVFGLPSQLNNFGTGGDVFEKIFAKIAENIKKINEEKRDSGRLFAVKMLKNNTGMNYSAIVIIRQLGGVTAAHTLMIEKTGAYPNRLVETIGGVQYDLVRTPAEAMDEDFARQIQNTASVATGVPADSICLVDSVLVPNEFDVENENAIVGLLSNSLNAVYVETEHLVNDFRGKNITELIADMRNGKFYVSLSFNSDDSSYFDATGMPVRQDVCVSLSYRTNSQPNRRSINQGEDQVEICRTYGYMDFEFMPSRPMNGMMQTQKFVSNFIITDVDSPTLALTPDLMMLGVASVASLNQDMAWTQAFRPTPARKNEIDFNDIGALNIEGNLTNDPTGYGRKYDTKSKTVQAGELITFLTAMCYPDMMVSIDLPKAGPKTWATSIFQYINFLNAEKAYLRMNDFLINATNGAYVPPNAPMFTGTTNKIHGGFYKTKDGVRDIRHLSSYLAVANFVAETSQAPAMLTQYTNTLYQASVPSDLRASQRRKFIDDMSGQSAVYKQMFDRVTFSRDTLRNWISALTSVGCSPIFSNMSGGNDMFIRRATADFGGAMLGQDIRFMGTTANPFNSWNTQTGYTRQW